MTQPPPDQPPRVGANFAGMRFIVAIWLVLGVIVARVLLQVLIDRNVEALHGDLLYEHAVEHLVLATTNAWVLVVALTFLPRGRGRWMVGLRLVICAGLSLMLLAGLPGGEPQYTPGWWSLKGRVGWLVLGILALLFGLMDRWAMSSRRFHFRVSPATLFATTAALLLVGGAITKAVFMVVEARRIYMVAEIMPASYDLLVKYHQERDVIAPVGSDMVGLRTGEIGDGGSRPALVVPAGTEVVYTVTPGLHTALRFHYGVDATSLERAPDDGEDRSVQFSIQIDGVERFRDRIDPVEDPEQRRWFEGEVKLGEFDGQEIQLRLCVDSRWSGPELRAGFGRPRLVNAERLPRNTGEANRQNVVVVSIDSLRADRLGCYGHRAPTTPHIDRLAAESLQYMRAISPSPLTWSAVASMLTGLYPTSHGVWAEDRSFLVDSLPTLAESLQNQRVTTGGWTNNPLISGERNYSQGFEVWREFNFQDGELLTHEFSDFVRRYKDYQFFTFLHYSDLRFPHHPEPRLRRLFTRSDDLDVNLDLAERAAAIEAGDEGLLFGRAELRQFQALYDAELRYVDEQIRDIQRILRQNGLWRRTVLIITSPHGEEFQEHGHLLAGRHLYQEQIHVPLLIRVPGMKGRRIEEPVDLTSLAGTVLHLFGMPDPLPRSPALPPWFSKESPFACSQTTRPVAGGEDFEFVFSMQDGQWKLILTSNRVGELYDLRADPGEQRNVIGENPIVARGLEAGLSRWAKGCAKRRVKTVQHELDPLTRQWLEEGVAVEAED